MATAIAGRYATFKEQDQIAIEVWKNITALAETMGNGNLAVLNNDLKWLDEYVRMHGNGLTFH
jgi:hypothetical protein